MKQRCPWCQSDPLYIKYHDTEWGVPVCQDKKHFEFLILESAQAGLNWLTILKKRPGYKKAFANFNPRKVAQFTQADVRRLMNNPNIIRNKLKIKAAINNAQVFLKVQNEFKTFSHYIWRFVGGRPKLNRWPSLAQVPSQSPESQALSRDMRQRGFKFVGPVILYAHMQATGLINDHITSCYRSPFKNKAT